MPAAGSLEEGTAADGPFSAAVTVAEKWREADQRRGGAEDGDETARARDPAQQAHPGRPGEWTEKYPKADDPFVQSAAFAFSTLPVKRGVEGGRVGETGHGAKRGEGADGRPG